MMPRRIWVDVTYTRTQTGNVGITRTVRKLLAALESTQAQSGVPCTSVAFHSQGFRVASPVSEKASAQARSAARVYRRLTGGKLRELAQACLPLSLLEAAWTLANRLTFDVLSAAEAPVAFRPGDLLVLADECWNYRAWRAAALARAQGATVVLVLYDLIPLRQPEYCPPLFTHVFRPWLLKMAANCDVVMCISRATLLDFQAFCREQKVARPPASHFRLGSDLVSAGNAGTVRAAVGAFAERPGALFAAVGTIEPRKNHALLLRVFERLWARGSEVRLLVAGRPHAACAELILRLQQHQEHGRRLLTVLDATDGEVNLAYSRSSALLFPTLAEGFGLPLVEARARGCRVIASSLPALLELADEGVQFFTPGSAEELEESILKEAARESQDRPPAPANFTWRDSAAAFLAGIGQLAVVPWRAGEVRPS